MSKVDFTNIHQHLNDKNAQFVDIREPYELQMDGHIEGFSCIPFYTALLHQNIVHYVRDPEREKTIENPAALEALFDKSKKLYLMCNSGNRSGYLTYVLKRYGYDVVNLGGIHDYYALKAHK